MVDKNRVHGQINVESLKSPCKQACLCICPFGKGSLVTGIEELIDDACYKYRAKCVEFKKIKNFEGDRSISSEGYFFLTGIHGEKGFEKNAPYTVILSGDVGSGKIQVNIIE